MKDKQAERRKRKRREAAMQAERQNAATLYAQYEAERKRLGLPKVPVKPDELMRMYRKTERDATVQAIMYGVIAGMYHLYDCYRWGKTRQLRFTGCCQMIITTIGTDERPVRRLIEDLMYDRIDLWDYANRVRCEPTPLVSKERVTELKLIHEKIMGALVVPVYVLHHYYNWGRKKTCRAAQAIQYALEEMLSYDCVNRYIRAIYKRTGVKADLEGRIMIDE